jgi:hypothetical protein
VPFAARTSLPDCSGDLAIQGRDSNLGQILTRSAPAGGPDRAVPLAAVLFSRHPVLVP